jgi:hypothetical protein
MLTKAFCFLYLLGYQKERKKEKKKFLKGKKKKRKKLTDLPCLGKKKVQKLANQKT